MAKIIIRNRFGQCPNSLLFDPKASLRAAGLYAYIHAKPDDWDFSSERIAMEQKEGRDAVRGALNELEELGYLIREKTILENGQFSMDYILLESPEVPEAGTDFQARTGTDLPASDLPASDFQAPIKERDTKKEIQKKNIFDVFWKKYPKKEGKLAAEKSFAKLSEKEQWEAINFLNNHISFWRKKYGEPGKEKFSTQYVPNPATWLNGRRWEDVLDTTPPPAKKQTAEDYEEARRKEEAAAKNLERERKEQERRDREAEEARQTRARALEHYKQLPPEQQRQIADKADSELSSFTGTKEKFPEQYRMLRESKIISLIATLQPTP